MRRILWCAIVGLTMTLPVAAQTPQRRDLSAVNDFLYQLQDLDVEAVGQTNYDLIVMDYTVDGSDETAYTSEDIAALKDDGKRIVLAYMSIGEAEFYRFYWQDDWESGTPFWLDAENPDWEGNFSVHYWEPSWQAIIFEYTDRLLAVGFDGAYLDLIDAFWRYYDQGRESAPQEMADFVAAIGRYARERDPDFLIFPQNGAELVTMVDDYLDVVDGIGQEDIYYGYEDDDEPTPAEITIELETHLDIFLQADKLVLTVDYATTPAYIDDAYARSRARGYVPFVTTRELDQLIINSGHEPD